jgi:WD40 repeat protein
MDNKNISNESSLHKFSPDNFPRCPNCNLISSLKLYYNEGEPIINYQCERGHQGFILLRDYLMKYNKFALSKEKCKECGKTQKELKGNFFFCLKCSKFICSFCQISHSNLEAHNIINFQRYDFLCKIHSNLYYCYCLNCKKNLCINCQKEHQLHNLIHLSKINFSEESKKNLLEEMKNLEIKINNLDTLKQNIISQINKLKESSELELKLIKILLNTYQYEESQNNLNFNVIQNLKNFKKTFKLYDIVYNEGNKYISLLHNLKKANLFKNNFKILKNHTSWITHLSKLNDGRLISSSGDYSLNIYKNETFELQMSIKEHLGAIHYFTQLNNGDIITCSQDKTMKIINLKGENKYNIVQTLIGHNHWVCKVIEIRKDELISISCDKTMKVWVLNEENQFICILTIIFQQLESNCNILRLNNKEFVTSSYFEKNIKFWNCNNYNHIYTLNNIETEWSLKIMCLLDDKILCIGGKNSKGFYLINIIHHQIIKNILGPKVIFSINKCLDGLFLCSIINQNSNHCLIKYKYENLDFKIVAEKEKAHEKNIYSCVELNDGNIASGGFDHLIKLWED